MAEDASAYAVLGLDPGADPGEIEQAYRRLIKAYHPDRVGGDARRAAEINRAYRELRIGRGLEDPLELNHDFSAPPKASRGWAAMAAVIALVLVAVIAIGGPAGPSADTLLSPSSQGQGVRAAKSSPSDVMDRPLNVAAIIDEAGRAYRLAHTRDEMALANESRECHQRLRRDPTLLQLDRCAAFDDAVVQLQDRDPLRDQGPFGELAVTGRLWSAASGISDDYVAIDGRLGRIRLEVEMALAQLAAPLN